jgi:ureidoacrylate peracid hydrolase
MHRYVMPSTVRERIDRIGRLPAIKAIDPRRTAFVIIDMQNYFCAEGSPAETPMARAIVPNINRLARTLRSAGGTVVWVQTTATGAVEKWHNYQTEMLTPERQQERLTGLDGSSEGFRLFPGLDVHGGDMRLKKVKYSAFIQGSSDIDAQLAGRDIDTVLIAGTLTNVCCESSARDAMMLGYRVALISDCNATLTDEEHSAALNTFATFFGDVVQTQEAITMIRHAPSSHLPVADGRLETAICAKST